MYVNGTINSKLRGDMEMKTDEGGMRVNLCYQVYKKDSKWSDK